MKMVVEVLVEFDYTAKEPDELSIKRGDVIHDVVCKKGGWWEGCLGNRRGVFPDNYVKVLDTSDQSVSLRNKSDSQRIRKCRVVFSYRPTHEDELPLNVDDVVNIVGEEEEGWWRGTLHGREGVFPSNFVEEIVTKGKSSKSGSRESLNDLESDLMVKSPILQPKLERLCQVKYAYTAENEDELSISEGDIITLISKDGQDPGWWRGELNGRVGVFPDNFVVILESKSNHQLSDQRSSLSGGNTVGNKHQPELESLASVTQPVLPINIKPSHIVQQRKSFEQKPSNVDSTPSADNSIKQAVPPVVDCHAISALSENQRFSGKKPVVPKKSPSGSGSTGGIFAGIKKKLADAVDGAAGSKSFNKDSRALSEDGGTPGEFDQVERNSILPDVRATRAKAPRRRPPSTAFKDSTPAPSDTPQLTNGNTVTADATLTSSVVSSSSGGSLDMLPELDQLPQTAVIDIPASTDEGQQPPIAVRPKVKEWEKHRAPWLEEMKLSQAKRTSTSPGPEKRPGGLKGTADGYDAPVTAVRTSKDGLLSGPPTSPQRTNIPASSNITSSPAPTSTPNPQTPPQATGVDMSRSMPALSGVLKTADIGDRPMLRSQQQQQTPKTVGSVVSAAIRTSLPIATDVKQRSSIPTSPLTPPPQTSSHPPTKITPPPKPQLHSVGGGDRDVSSANGDSAVGSRHADGESTQSALISELLDRVNRLETESRISKVAIEDLRGKLQVETDLRRLLQTELDKVSRCVMQV